MRAALSLLLAAAIAVFLITVIPLRDRIDELEHRLDLLEEVKATSTPPVPFHPDRSNP